MDKDVIRLFMTCGIGAVLVLTVGFYALVRTKNLIRALIGLEMLTKSATLLIIVSGYASGHVALAQALAITLIIVEVAVIVVAVGLVLRLHKTNDSLDTDQLRSLKG